MRKFATIRELRRLVKQENKFFRDIRTQFVGYSRKEVAVVGGSTDTEFLLGLLFELYSGHLYGDRCLVRVFLVDAPKNLKKTGFVYSSVWTSGLPLFHVMYNDRLYMTSDPRKALKKVDYVIIHPFVPWDKEISRDQIIKEKFHFFRKLSFYIADYCRNDVEVLLVGNRCMIPFRLILAMCLVKLPQTQIHGLSRVIERGAASLIGNKMECNPTEVRGVAVFGEDIVDVKNAWIQWDHDCEEDLLDFDSMKNAHPELAELMEDRLALQAAGEALRLPDGEDMVGIHQGFVYQDDLDLPPLVVPRGDGQGLQFGLGRCASGYMDEPRVGKEEEVKAEEVEEEETDTSEASDQKKKVMGCGTEPGIIPKADTDLPSESYEKRHFQARLKDRLLEWNQWVDRTFITKSKEDRWDPIYTTGKPAVTRFLECSQAWQCMVYPKPLVFPDNVKDTKDNSKRWVLTNIEDQKFLKGTILKKCRHTMSGYSYAKGIITYIKKVLLEQKPVHTNEVVCSPGIYGIPEGLFSSFPVRIDKKGCRILKGFQLMNLTKIRIKKMVKDIMSDYELVFGLFHEYPPREATLFWHRQTDEEARDEGIEDEVEPLVDLSFEMEGEGMKEEIAEEAEETVEADN